MSRLYYRWLETHFDRSVRAIFIDCRRTMYISQYTTVTVVFTFFPQWFSLLLITIILIQQTFFIPFYFLTLRPSTYRYVIMVFMPGLKYCFTKEPGSSTILEFKTVTKKGFLNVDVDRTIRLMWHLLCILSMWLYSQISINRAEQQLALT